MNVGSNSQTVKKSNRALALYHFLIHGVSTRIELAKKTKLTKRTITNIVQDLIEDKYLVEGIPLDIEKLGRRPVGLLLSSEAPKLIGVDISRTGCQAVLTDLRLQIIKHSTFIPFSEETSESIIAKAIQIIEEIIPKEERVLGIGVATVGQHDLKSGKVLCPVDFYGIRDMPIKAILSSYFKLPICVDNSMNGTALVEMLYGNGKDVDNFIYVGITKGVGGALVIGGELLSNRSGLIGEIGHICVDVNGPPCPCGNVGCLELYSSITYIEKEIAERRGYFAPFAECVKENDADVQAVLNKLCDLLIVVLTGIVNTLDPQIIIMGHHASLLPEAYLKQIEEGINKRTIARNYKHVEVKTPAFGMKSHILGSAAFMLHRLILGDIY